MLFALHTREQPFFFSLCLVLILSIVRPLDRVTGRLIVLTPCSDLDVVARLNLTLAACGMYQLQNRLVTISLLLISGVCDQFHSLRLVARSRLFTYDDSGLISHIIRLLEYSGARKA